MMKSNIIFTDTLQQAFEQAGYNYPEKNGAAFARFSTNGKPGDTAGWLREYEDGEGAVFGCWRNNEQFVWQKKREDGRPLNHAEIEALRAKAKVAKEEAEAKREAEYAEAAIKAKEYINGSIPAEAHPYLGGKGIDPCGSLLNGSDLVIPVYGPDGIQSYQTIDLDGNKKFMYGGRVAGGYFAIGKLTDRIIVCEGFATGASIHMATGDGVVVAFNSGNLGKVSKLMRERHPGLQMVIAGDDDTKTQGNPGKKAATSAAKDVHGRAVFPEGAKDFNDMAQERGLDAVKAMFSFSKAPIGYDAASVTGEFNAPDYLIKGVLNRGDMSVTFGDSGSMKSFVELDKALRLGMGWAWNGHRVKRAMTLIILGEGAGGYRRRIRAWLQHHDLLDKEDQPWVWVIDKAAELYSDPKGLETWIAEVEAYTRRKVDHVLVDTLNTNMGHGGDENDAVAVGGMLANSQTASKGCAITFVHHVGHGDKGRERGSYAIRGNMDNRTLVERDEDGKGKIITVSSLKVKDGEEFKPVNMTYEVVVLGTDAEGDDITSLCMVPTTDEPVAAPKAKYAGPNQTLFQRALTATVERTGNNSKEDVRQTFYMMMDGTDAAKRQAFNRGWNTFMNNSTKGE